MKFIKNTLIAFIAFFAIVNISFAGNISHANVSQYSVTINKIEIYNSTTAKWITIASTPKVVDIASADAGAAIGSMTNSGVTLTFGSYTKVRATVSDTFTIAACSDSGGSTCTTATNQGAQALVANADTAVAGSVTVNSGVDIVSSEIILATPFEMSAATTTMSSTISFNLDNVFSYGADGNGWISTGEPIVTVTMQQHKVLLAQDSDFKVAIFLAIIYFDSTKA